MKAIVLFSGGLDSTVVLAKVLSEKREVFALSFDYGQNHLVELEAAKKIASHYGVSHQILKIPQDTFRGSSLIGDGEVPKNRDLKTISESGIPNTYVPARNTLFFAFAMGLAEVHDASEIYYGANCLDLTGYPDCRPEFIEAFQKVLNLGSKRGSQGKSLELLTPLLYLNKSQIISLGRQLKAPIELTFSCYSPTENQLMCGVCDACLLRQTGFSDLATY